MFTSLGNSRAFHFLWNENLPKWLPLFRQTLSIRLYKHMHMMNSNIPSRYGYAIQLALFIHLLVAEAKKSLRIDKLLSFYLGFPASRANNSYIGRLGLALGVSVRYKSPKT